MIYIFIYTGYLCNVLAALDQHPTSTLTSLEKLLKADKEMYDIIVYSYYYNYYILQV